MTRFCLDTSGYIRFRAGNPQVVDLVRYASWIGIPTVVLGELWAGFRQGSKADYNLTRLQEFLAHPVVHLLPVTANVAQIYGEVVTDLRKRGTSIPAHDAWIAATSIDSGASLVTFDNHFRAVLRLGLLLQTG